MGRATTTFITGGVRTIGRRGGTTIIHAEDPSLVLDLQFARDAAYVSRRGPLPTFTRASQARYVNSAGLIVPAAINTPRLDYDPTTLASRGLLIEDQRTNLCPRSDEFTNAAWTKSSTTATADQTLAPDGSVTADLIAETTAATSHSVYQASPSGVTSGTAYTASMFLKKGTGATAPDWVIIGFLHGGFGATRIAFNVSTGAVGSTTGSISSQVTQFLGGWWRIAITANATATASWGTIVLSFNGNTNSSLSIPIYVGQTTSDVFVWGAQFEAGAFATSYIPTTSAAVVRSADVCSITGGAFTGFYNQTEGTLVFRGVKQALAAAAANPAYLGVDDGTAGNRIITYGGTAETGQIKVGGVNQASLGGVTQAAALTPFAIAVRYKANDFAFCLNGGTVSTDVSGTVPTVTQMLLGIRLATEYMGGWIQSVQYYNRIKTNAQLQTLSTP